MTFTASGTITSQLRREIFVSPKSPLVLTVVKSPGCPTGGCLRSQVNKTETAYALSMITKAGVPAKQVIMGLPLYGRSFKLAEAGCTGPDCHFTGPLSGATPGVCTDT